MERAFGQVLMILASGTNWCVCNSEGEHNIFCELSSAFWGGGGGTAEGQNPHLVARFPFYYFQTRCACLCVCVRVFLESAPVFALWDTRANPNHFKGAAPFYMNLPKGSKTVQGSLGSVEGSPSKRPTSIDFPSKRSKHKAYWSFSFRT